MRCAMQDTVHKRASNRLREDESKPSNLETLDRTVGRWGRHVGLVGLLAAI